MKIKFRIKYIKKWNKYMVQHRKRRYLYWVDDNNYEYNHGCASRLEDAKRFLESRIKEITESYNIPRISNEVTLEL